LDGGGGAPKAQGGNVLQKGESGQKNNRERVVLYQGRKKKFRERPTREGVGAVTTGGRTGPQKHPPPGGWGGERIPCRRRKRYRRRRERKR